MSARRLAELVTAPPARLRPGDLALLEHAGLAALLASRLPADYPDQPLLQPARLSLLGRQMMTRRTMRALLQAWHEAGIQAVLLKGFALSEWVYRVPGVRPYGDVDVLIRKADLPAALHAARQLGWHTDGLEHTPQAWTHELAHALSPDGQVRLDLHRYLTHWHGGRARKVQQLTEAVWADSQEVLLDGVPVRMPAIPDLALHLALARAWGDDAGQLKPADYPDLQTLMERAQLTPAQLRAHAQRRGAAHTWAAFLTVCNPWRRTFRLADNRAALRLQVAATLDGRLLWLPTLESRVRRAPGLLWRLLRSLPDVLAIQRQLRRAADPRTLPARWRLNRAAPLSDHLRDELVLGIRRVTRLWYPRSPGSCVPRSLATYRALVRRGYPAVYVSGVRRHPDGRIEGHAWVEGPDGPLWAYLEPHNREHYTVLFEHRAGEAAP
ncbi:lasso peptide biosynthesis B2 protein [Deinococcus sonorensis]|uniref:Lasso peptide biosynthesis B2 protein n=2 Tax=Deinococcus sonorensis TaxID=309891 RepID=A0AAU7UA32_9DEIO